MAIDMRVCPVTGNIRRKRIATNNAERLVPAPDTVEVTLVMLSGSTGKMLLHKDAIQKLQVGLSGLWKKQVEQADIEGGQKDWLLNVPVGFIVHEDTHG